MNENSLASNLRARSQVRRAFSLVELLVVMAIIAILVGLSVASIKGLQDSGNITQAANNITGVLENARAYAMANNTYVWVGFYEEATTSAGASALHNQAPPYKAPAVGRLVIGVAAALDGTSSLTTTNLTAVQKLTIIPNIHLTNINTTLAPAASNTSLPNNLAGRPLADSFLDSEDSSTSSELPSATESFQLNNYQFYKAICFNPQGGAEMETPNKVLQHAIEIGLVPTHNGAVNTTTKNLVALQITGAVGSVKIYRQ